MIQLLKELERNETILRLLADSDYPNWGSLNIDYHPPHVERVWTDLDNGMRLSFHVIHPCEKEIDALWHPHAWPAAFHVLSMSEGIYKQGFAMAKRHLIDDTIEELDYFTVMEVKEGEFYYSMDHRDLCHAVTPIDGIVYTVMLSAKPKWPENAIKPNKELKPLSAARKKEILDKFFEYYLWKK